MSLPAYDLDFIRQVQQGAISGARIINQAGTFSPTTGQARSLWTLGATANQPVGEANTSLEIISSSASDTSAGTGAKTVYIEGIKLNGALQTETVSMNGTAAVALANTYARINLVRAATVGSTETNAGNIDVRTVSGSTVWARMATNRGVEGMVSYTVPSGKNLYILDLEYSSVGTGADGSPPLLSVNFQGWEGLSQDTTMAVPLYRERHRWMSYRGQTFTKTFGYGFKLAAGTLWQPVVQNLTANTVEVSASATYLEISV
jgi:hypothetical protein